MKSVSFALFLFCLTGCATWNRTFFSNDLAMLSMGMSKQEVIQQLNKPEQIVLSKQTDEGQLEVFEYVEKPAIGGRINPAFWTSYWVCFLDGKLTGYERAEVVNAGKRQERIAQLEAMKGMGQMPINQNVNVIQNVGVLRR